MLRASSLPAVTSFVWSTRPSPTSSAAARNASRTPRSASSFATATTCRDTDGATSETVIELPRVQTLEERHARARVQGGPHVAHTDAELDERDRDRGLD